MDTERLGNVSAADDALVAAQVEDEAADRIDAVGNALWSYQNESTINGVPVAEGDRGLKIDRDDVLAVAFVLVRHPHSMLVYMSPDDAEGNARYSEILEQAAEGRVDIVDELRQWDQAASRFVLWLRYDTLEYKLHPRFGFLREE